MRKIITTIGILLFPLCSLAQKIDTLANLDPAKFNQDFSQYDQGTAVYLAQLSDLVYAKDTGTVNTFLLKYMHTYPGHLISTRWINEKSISTNTQVMLWATKNFLIISIRGTQFNMGNILTDLKYHNYDDRDSTTKLAYYNLPAGHAGFRDAIRKLIKKEDFFGRLAVFMQQAYPATDIKTIPIYLTGHSLGTALAQMLVEPIRYNGYQLSGMYFIAPPLAVSCIDNKQMQEKFGNITYNIVNYKDYVPRAGLRGTLAHFGKFYRICNDSSLSSEPERYVEMGLPEKKLFYKYHSLENHIRLLSLSINSSSLVNQRKNDCFDDLPIRKLCQESKK